MTISSLALAVVALAFALPALLVAGIGRRTGDLTATQPASPALSELRTPMQRVSRTVAVPVSGPRFLRTFPSPAPSPADARRENDLLQAGSYDAVARSLSRDTNDRSRCAVDRPLRTEQAVTYGEASVTVLGPTAPVRRRCSICLN